MFAKLEWIIRYKGNCSEEDARKLERLSNTLSIFDFYLDDSLRDRKNTTNEYYKIPNSSSIEVKYFGIFEKVEKRIKE